MSNKFRLKKKKTSAGNLRDKARLSADQRADLSQTIKKARHFQQEGNFQLAEKLYRQALAVDPGDPGANHSLGSLYKQTGHLAAAVPFLERAIAAKPNYVEAYDNLGFVCCILGRFDKAIACYSRLLLLKPDSPNGWRNFSLLMRSRIFPDSIASGRDRKNILTNCVARHDLEPQNLFHACLHELFSDDLLTEIQRFSATEQSCESYLDFLGRPLLKKLFSEQLFLLMLRRIVVAERIAETFLTSLRKGLAMLLAANGLDEQFYVRMTPVVCALAQQCYLNEYVFQATEIEAEFLAEIICQLRADKPLTPQRTAISLALAACYGPLASYEIPDKLIRYSGTSDDLAGLIQTQLVETGREVELLASIQSFSEISDEISQRVKQQYEENPYPRWTGTFLGSSIPFGQYLRQDIAPNSLADLQTIERPEVLIAGCGTGRQPITSAAIYLNSSVVAIDLSRASLAYAKRKAEELEIHNIKFLQGDILELPRLQRTFDIIECAGVLHHMRDPRAGFRVLVALLKPAGYMRIGLYSEIARQDIVAAQNFARDNAYQPTPEGIRTCRQALFALSDDDMAKKATLSSDFYTTSTVRDLVFHVQEHRFTLPEISQLLGEHNLEFLGFTLSMELKNCYLAEYKDDPAAISLANWHRYELEHPETFVGMYNFWTRKKNP